MIIHEIHFFSMPSKDWKLMEFWSKLWKLIVNLIQVILLQDYFLLSKLCDELVNEVIFTIRLILTYSSTSADI